MKYKLPIIAIALLSIISTKAKSKNNEYESIIEKALMTDAINAAVTRYCVPSNEFSCNPNEIAHYDADEDRCICNTRGAVWYPRIRKCQSCREGKEYVTPDGCKPCGEGVKDCDIEKGPLNCYPGYYFITGDTTTERVCHIEKIPETHTRWIGCDTRGECSLFSHPEDWHTKDWLIENTHTYVDEETGEIIEETRKIVNFNTSEYHNVYYGEDSGDGAWTGICAGVKPYCSGDEDWTDPAYEGRLKEFVCSHSCAETEDYTVMVDKIVCEDVIVPSSPNTCKKCEEGTYCPDGINKKQCAQVDYWHIKTSGAEEGPYRLEYGDGHDGDYEGHCIIEWFHCAAKYTYFSLNGNYKQRYRYDTGKTFYAHCNNQTGEQWIEFR